jgi:hypothetical protein
MNDIWDVDSNDDNNDSDNEASHSQEAKFALMAMVEDISSGMDVETIIISKNIIDPITIELLRKIAELKKPKTQQSTMICEQSTVQASLKQPSSDLQEEEIKVAPSTSTLEVVNGPTVSFSTSMTLEEQVVSSPKVNYFANLPSDSNESDDEFDLCTISYPSNSSNIHLSHTRTLAHFESSSNILKARILELEKMVSIYQSNMDEFERTKNELSKYKSENAILNVQIQTLKTENRVLKTSSDLRDITNLNLELIYGTRRSHDKSGLGYVKDLTLSNSKPKNSPTLKGKQTNNVFAKNVKPSVGKNDKPNNHAYQYRYSNMKNTKSTFRPKDDNRIYHRGPNGWSYDIENKKVF